MAEFETCVSNRDRRIIRAGLPTGRKPSAPSSTPELPAWPARSPASPHRPQPPARGVKAVDVEAAARHGMRLIQERGHIPSVAEVAVRSNVSRATAYRYFPSRSALVTAVIDTSLGPVRSFRSTSPDGRERAARAVREDLPALQGVRAAAARGRAADAGAMGARARRPARGRAVSARPPRAHPRARARAAGAASCRRRCASGCTVRCRSSTASSPT